MRVALVGGSFNPPHNGHLHILRTIADSGAYDRIICMPLHTPNHKSSEHLLPPAVRLELTELLIDHAQLSIPCTVSSLEIDRGGFSYTIDTVRSLIEQYESIDIVIGDDLLEGLPSWYRIDELSSLARFVVLTRENEVERIRSVIRILAERGIHVTLIASETVRVSSSQVRKALHSHEDVSDLLPGPVLRYVEEHGLYTGS